MNWIIFLIIAFTVGYIIGRISEIPDQKFVKRNPNKEEILVVLRTIKSSLRLSPYENDCFDEAYRLIESMPNEEEE